MSIMMILHNFVLVCPIFVKDIVNLIKTALNLLTATAKFYLENIHYFNPETQSNFPFPFPQIHSSTLNTLGRISFTYFIKHTFSFYFFNIIVNGIEFKIPVSNNSAGVHRNIGFSMPILHLTHLLGWHNSSKTFLVEFYCFMCKIMS